MSLGNITWSVLITLTYIWYIFFSIVSRLVIYNLNVKGICETGVLSWKVFSIGFLLISVKIKSESMKLRYYLMSEFQIYATCIKRIVGP